MDIVLYFLAIIAGFVLLVKGSDFFVDGAAGLASKFGISQLIIGLTIVAMGTSAPEAAVSITAAFSGSADITIGNVVGSNIMNILVILGLASAIIPIAVAKSTVKVELPFLLAISVIFLLLGLGGEVGRVDGLIMWGLFLAYLTYLFYCAKNGMAAQKEEEQKDENKKDNMVLTIVFIVGGAVAIVLGSKIAVWGASELAKIIGISERVVGLTIVALGTSLPELFTSVTAARKGNADIAIGNIVGSNIFNILFVCGTTALITPVPFAKNFIVDSTIVVAATLFLLLCAIPKKKVGRLAGVTMLLGYVGYFVYLMIG